MAFVAGDWIRFNLLLFSDPAWLTVSTWFDLPSYLVTKAVAFVNSLPDPNSYGYVESVSGPTATIRVPYSPNPALLPVAAIFNDVVLTEVVALNSNGQTYQIAKDGGAHFMLADSLVVEFNAAESANMVAGFS